MEDNDVLTAKQKKALEFLWFKYGNGGSCSSNANHKYLQRLVEGRDEEAKAFERQITLDCRKAVERIRSEDYKELSEGVRKMLDAFEVGML